MPQIRFVLFLVLLFNSTTIHAFSQTASVETVEIETLTDSAVAFFNKSDYQKSLLTSRVALNYAIQQKDNVLTAKCYNIVAANYHVLSQYTKGIFYYEKALSFAEKTANDVMKYKINNNLGTIYFFEKKQHQRGLNHFKKALAFAKKIKNYESVFTTNLNICWAFFEIENFENGKKYLQVINKNQNQYLSPTTSTVFYLVNGMFARHQNHSKLADSYFLKAIEEGKKWEKDSDLSFAYLEYSKFLNAEKKFEQAYAALRQYNSITKQLNDVELFSKTEAESANLELDEYRREISKIENEKDIQKENFEKSKLISFLFLSISFIFLVLIGSLFINVNYKKRLNAKLMKANEDLQEAKEQAEEASKLKTQFISTISHEVRTPLYGVIGITNMILEEHKELSDSKHLKSLKFSARYLLTLVNDILQINKIEEKKLVLETTVFNLSDEINLITNALSFLAQNNHNEIITYTDPNIPEYLIGDKLRLSQIIMNLVNNALKFTKNGTVTIKAKLVKTEGDLFHIEFQVQDTGIGIPLADQEKIFEKFVQLSRKNTDYQGTGLGLAIVKRLLSLFKSSITLKSEVDKGTTFTFTIAFEHNEVKYNQIINAIEVDLTSNIIVNVLVVEDNTINQIVTKKIIEKNNYTCQIVEDGLSAIEILKTEKFDVILMDINMPILNGFETTKRIRKMGVKTPIIALTAFDKEEIVEEALASGMNDIIIKPFDPLKLFKIINCLVYKTIPK
ncbi:response regulator [Flavobacterium agrisoli]|uniref:histidine kinase n=1 Tax=Flavobacterium agrisoli TaxID=2793066 RepID=A0A934UI50_9FLAO|nr:response regulator [Flavobacterium agrisoli]MBK0368476.1 response regulator [Flavobacterium agrisoli]